MAEPLPDPTTLSIIIPVLNEAELLDRCLSRLFAGPACHADFEVIVCDGGSNDETLSIIKDYPCQLVQSSPGRAVQMNAGSRIAQGSWLLFLHVDSSLPEGYLAAVTRSGGWGFFYLRLNGDHFLYRVISSAINLRSSLSHVAGGDQGLFFKTSFFQSIQQFPQIPLMEDIAICKLARQLARPDIIKRPLSSSSRRWQENGIIKTVVLMWSLRLAYWLGVDPLHLHKLYYPQRGQ